MSYSGSVGRQTIGSLGSSEDSTNGSLKKPTFSERHPKVVKSLTVVAYIFCVSLAALVLSAYYIVIWTPDPTKPTEASRVHQQDHPNSTLCYCRFTQQQDEISLISSRRHHRPMKMHAAPSLPRPQALKQQLNLKEQDASNETVNSIDPDTTPLIPVTGAQIETERQLQLEETVTSTTSAPPEFHSPSGTTRPTQKHHKEGKLVKRSMPNSIILREILRSRSTKQVNRLRERAENR